MQVGCGRRGKGVVRPCGGVHRHPAAGTWVRGEGDWKAPPERVRDPYPSATRQPWQAARVRRRPWKAVGSRGDHSPRLSTCRTTDSGRVPRGNGEKHPGEGSERDPETADVQAVQGGRSAKTHLRACLLKNEPTSGCARPRKVKGPDRPGAGAKASLKGAQGGRAHRTRNRES